jgi:hypothetical protein
MVCLPLIIPDPNVPIGQQAPVSPSHPLRSPFSKPMLGQVCANARDDKDSIKNKILIILNGGGNVSYCFTEVSY